MWPLCMARNGGPTVDVKIHNWPGPTVDLQLARAIPSRPGSPVGPEQLHLFFPQISTSVHHISNMIRATRCPSSAFSSAFCVWCYIAMPPTRYITTAQPPGPPQSCPASGSAQGDAGASSEANAAGQRTRNPMRRRHAPQTRNDKGSGGTSSSGRSGRM